MYGIDQLLHPVSLEDYRNNIKGRKAIYIEGDLSKFNELFSWDDANNLLNFGNLGHPAVRLVHKTDQIPPKGLVDRNEWLRKGATLIINSVQRYDPIVSRFANILSSDLNTQVNINSYSSFPEKQGFDLHFDFHDVFIIQLEGEKSWKVYEPTLTYPTGKMKKGNGAKDTAEKPNKDPYLEVTMTEGDVMYIPRGHWHYAVSVTPSLHFTVGPQARTPSHFLNWLVEKSLWEEEYFRRDFPIVDAHDLGGRMEGTELEDSVSEFRNKGKGNFRRPRAL